MEGWIKLHRKLLDWQWFKVPDMVQLFIYMLLKANHDTDEWRGIKVTRGQLITGLNSLHSGTGISIQTLRTCLKRLEKSGEINTQSTNKYTIITICNYESYQTDQQTKNSKTNKQLTNNQQTTNKQLTTNKNIKNEENLINEEERITLPFDSEIFAERWVKYKAYRKKKDKFTFHDVDTEKTALNQLVKLANGSEQTAIEIIDQSLVKGWKGLFKLDQHTQTQNNSPPQSTNKAQQIIDNNKKVLNDFLIDIQNGKWGSTEMPDKGDAGKLLSS